MWIVDALISTAKYFIRGHCWEPNWNLFKLYYEWLKILFHKKPGDDNDVEYKDDDGDDDVHKAGRLDSIPGDLASQPLS